jgi:hypothetical protein
MNVTIQQLYHSVMHNNESLTDIQRLYYLRSAQKGNVIQVFHLLQLTAAHYPMAWNLLQVHYKNNRIIGQIHIRTLSELLKIEIKSATAIRLLHDNTLKQIKALKALGQPTDSSDTLNVHMISLKLDSFILALAQSDVLPAVKDCTSFLQKDVKFWKLLGVIPGSQ